MPPHELTLNPEQCRARQARLQATMERMQVDRVLLLAPENVQWLTGFRPHRLMSSAATLDLDGTVCLSVPNEEPEGVAADCVVVYEAQWRATLRQEQSLAATQALKSVVDLRPAAAQLAAEFSICGPIAELGPDTDIGKTCVDIEPQLWKLRRFKHDDELRMIRRSIACTDAMYEAAREMIRPGVSELDVYNRLHAAAVEVAGEPLTALGNDFQCNSPGGPPRSRVAQSGELYILDLSPVYRGYYADNCRTIAVEGPPTDCQMDAWRRIVSVLEMVEDTVVPGMSCAEVFRRAQTELDDYRPDAFFHHLGHGFGLFPHEAPHLNSAWDDTFEEGDVFTAEPGLYGPELRAGIRLEQNYRVTADGVERLTAFPLDL
ncbi:MAG: Xaa-Pro peptidase family protein [Planctomycetaceae bacterium]